MDRSVVRQQTKRRTFPLPPRTAGPSSHAPEPALPVQAAPRRPAVRVAAPVPQPVAPVHPVQQKLQPAPKTTHRTRARHTNPQMARAVHKRIERAERNIEAYRENARVQHELKEMQGTHDLRDIDDDVEDIATLLEWHAQEHEHRPKSPVWFAALASGVTVISLGFALFGNIIAAITIGFAGALTYFIAQQEPKQVRYRFLTDGLAMNNTFYHYRDLQSFNIVYQPGEVKTVVLRSKRPFSPILHMEIGDADPVMIRDVLIEFVEEDLDLNEPLIDIWARRLGF